MANRCNERPSSRGAAVLRLGLVCGLTAAASTLGGGPWDDLRCPALSAPLPRPTPLRGDAPLGFVLHWGQPGTSRYTASGASSMLTNLFFWQMRDRDSQLVDYSRAEEWLRYLYSNGLGAAVIVDSSIHHTSIPWRSACSREAGQNIVDADGRTTVYSSPLSATYRRMVDQYIVDLTGWVRRNDPERRVTTYVNGAEVFWPGVLDFGPSGAACFRRWLADRYGGIDDINQRLSAAFAAVSDVPVVPVWRIGSGKHGPRQFVFRQPGNGAWVTPVPDTAPGAEYRISAEVLADADPTAEIDILIAWTAANHAPAHSETASADPGTNGWRPLRTTVAAPDWAERGAMYLHFQGTGSVRWRRPDIRSMPDDRSVILNRELTVGDGGPPGHWTQAVWNGDVDFTVVHSRTPPELRLASIPDSSAQTDAVCRPDVWWYDFHTCAMETYAQTMNRWARRIRECDPDRQVMHYLGFTLGTLGQWDDLMFTQRADIFLGNAPDVDVHGLQLCAGKGDFHYATVNLDLARKYEKPMVATDLQDFTHGVYVGFGAMNRTALACVAHGMDGAYFYCWHDHNIDYNWFGNWTMRDTRRLLSNVRECIGFLKGARAVVDVAFLHPLQPYSVRDSGGGKSDMLDSMGWYKAVCQAGLWVDVVTPYELADAPVPVDLSVYRLVIVPDCPVLPRAAATALAEFVRHGGALLGGGRPPTHDETGALLPDPVVSGVGAGAGPDGVRLDKGTVHWLSGVPGRQHLGPVERRRDAGNTPPLFLPARERPSTRLPGEGLPGTIRTVAAARRPIAIRIDPPDPSVELTVYRGEDGGWRVVMIHTGDGMHRGGCLTIPGRRDGASPGVWADFEERQIDVPGWDEAAGSSSVQLPVFADCCMVRW